MSTSTKTKHFPTHLRDLVTESRDKIRTVPLAWTHANPGSSGRSGRNRRERKRRRFIKRFGDSDLDKIGIRNGLPEEIIQHILGFCPTIYELWMNELALLRRRKLRRELVNRTKGKHKNSCTPWSTTERGNKDGLFVVIRCNGIGSRDLNLPIVVPRCTISVKGNLLQLCYR